MRLITDDSSLHLVLRPADGGFSTELAQRPASILSRPLEFLPPGAVEQPQGLSGAEDSLSWRTEIRPQAGGFWLHTTVQVQQPTRFNPSMILWLGLLEELDERQSHTWRQTVVRAPTTNQQGLGGNDLPACYLYDHATKTESICYFPPDMLSWASRRFYEFAMREVFSYRIPGKYGLGLVPSTPETLFDFAPGTHHMAWWFTQRRRDDIPSPWQAGRAVVQAVAPLLAPVPHPMLGAIPWQQMAQGAMKDLEDEACWVSVEGQTGLRAYVRGSSPVGRDEARGFELMTQLDVLWPLLLWQRAAAPDEGGAVTERILRTLPLFERATENFVTNNFPPRRGDTFMDTWYFLENALIKLPWVAYLTGGSALQEMAGLALRGARQLAHNTAYLFPLFADAQDWRPRGSLLNVGVGGLYAAGCVIAHQLDGRPEHLDEAAAALRTMHQLPPGMLTHEPQQISFAAAAAQYLAKLGHGEITDELAADLVYLSLRMGYWGSDPAVPFYDPRGMFQACASLCYPAYKENVETILPWAELLRDTIEPAPLMLAFMNLQRRHNYAFFDPYLPKEYRHGPCAFIPYEDLATAEFSFTARLGKELYGAGEVFWSALLFDALGRVDAPDVLCLCLDVPAVQLRTLSSADPHRYLLYNPAPDERSVTFHSAHSTQQITLPPMTSQLMNG